jgi:hypothetical protein
LGYPMFRLDKVLPMYTKMMSFRGAG